MSPTKTAHHSRGSQSKKGTPAPLPIKLALNYFKYYNFCVIWVLYYTIGQSKNYAFRTSQREWLQLYAKWTLEAHAA